MVQALRRDGFSLATMTMMKAMMIARELLWRVTDSLKRLSRPSCHNRTIEPSAVLFALKSPC
jgi:hypothetical protein